ncbi:filamentous hemagglutinin family N-terminal domain-containing protein, partial [Pseudovibrio ascidiaceicola]
MLKKIKRSVALLLSVVLTFQPVLVYAGEVRPVNPSTGPRPHVGEAPNGTPVINISTPNSSGVSHDRYTSFDVKDLILNNSATITDTRLGGWIEGNPNLRPGSEAQSWIGEIVGGNQAQLNGVLEVAGKRMDVILANEFGITCDGCGFINSGRTTLTTGQPRFEDNGALAGFDVRRGTVTIGAGGLNQDSRLFATDRSRVDVISRAAAIYGAVHADELNLMSGANAVAYNWSYNEETGEVSGVTPLSSLEETPEFAVDVSALGGMYANAIKLVATEKGVGVRLNGEMASATNIALSANGTLSLGGPTSGHAPLIKARKKVSIRNTGPLLLEGSVSSETNDTVYVRSSDGSLTVAGEISGGAVTLEGAGLVEISGVLKAESQLRATSKQSAVQFAEQAQVEATELNVSAADNLSIKGRLSVTDAAKFAAGSRLTTSKNSVVTAKTIALEAGQLETNGYLATKQSLTLNAKAGGGTNSGSLVGRDVKLTSAGSFKNLGKINATNAADFTIADTFESATETELFAKNIELTTGSATLNGTIKAEEMLVISSLDKGLENNGALIGATVKLSSAEGVHNEGTISAESLVQITADTQFSSLAGSEVSADTVAITAGRIEADG